LSNTTGATLPIAAIVRERHVGLDIVTTRRYGDQVIDGWVCVPGCVLTVGYLLAAEVAEPAVALGNLVDVVRLEGDVESPTKKVFAPFSGPAIFALARIAPPTPFRDGRTTRALSRDMLSV